MYKKYAVEFLGSLFFIFVIVATGEAIPIGLALILAIMIGGKISGGHFNPAVTLTMFFNGKLPANDVPFYILCQILGGICAVFLKKIAF